MSSDQAIHRICIASIKRSTMKPFDFKWTKFYETNEEFPYSTLDLLLEENERLICSTVIDWDKYSILTTRRFINSSENGSISYSLTNAKYKSYGNFKGYGNEPFTLGKLELADGSIVYYYIESSYASMVMIYGIRTIVEFYNKSEEDINKTLLRWSRSK